MSLKYLTKPFPPTPTGSRYVKNAHAYARTASREAADLFSLPAGVPEQDVALPTQTDSLRTEDALVFRVRQAVLQRIRAPLAHGATPRGAPLHLYYLQQELLQPY